MYNHTDLMAEFADQKHFFDTTSVQFLNTSTVLELYKASEITIHEEEPILERIYQWTRTFLQNQLSNHEIGDLNLLKEVMVINTIRLASSFR